MTYAARYGGLDMGDGCTGTPGLYPSLVGWFE
jgi:hypothetical protein